MAFYSHELLSSPLFKSFWRASVGPISAGGEHAKGAQAAVPMRRLKRTEALEAAHLIKQGVEALQRLLDGKEQLLEDLAAGDTGRRRRHALGEGLTAAAAEGHVPVMLTLVVPAQLLVGIVRVHHTQGLYLKQDCERALIYISSSTPASAVTEHEAEADEEVPKKAGRGAKRTLASLLLPEQPANKRKQVDITLPDEDEMYGTPINLRLPALRGDDSLRMSRSLLARTPSGQEPDAITMLRTGGPTISLAVTAVTGLGRAVSGPQDSGRAGAGLLARRLPSLPAEDELFEPVPDLLLLEPHDIVEELLHQHQDLTFDEAEEPYTPVQAEKGTPPSTGTPAAPGRADAAPGRADAARRIDFEEADVDAINAEVPEYEEEAGALSGLGKGVPAQVPSTGTTQVYGEDAAGLSPEGGLARTQRVEGAAGGAEGEVQQAAKPVRLLLPPRKIHKSQIDDQATVLSSRTVREALDNTSDIVRRPLLARVHATLQAASAAAQPAPSIVRALTKRNGKQTVQGAAQSVASVLTALLPAASHHGLLGHERPEPRHVRLSELAGLSGLTELLASEATDNVSAQHPSTPQGSHPLLPRPVFPLAPQLSALMKSQLQPDKHVPLEPEEQEAVKGAPPRRKRAKRAAEEGAEQVEEAAVQPAAAAAEEAHPADVGALEQPGSPQWLAAAEADMQEGPGAPEAEDIQHEMFEDEEPEHGAGMERLDFHMLAPQGPEQQAGLLATQPSALSGSIPQLLAATQRLAASDLSALVESSGSEPGVVNVLTERSLQVAAVYKEALQTSVKASVPMSQFTAGNTRITAARWFVDSLVLMNTGLMTMKQGKAFEDIQVSMHAAATA